MTNVSTELELVHHAYMDDDLSEPPCGALPVDFIFSDPSRAARDEIQRLNTFIESWFRGMEPKESFDEEFSERLHDKLEIVQPSGTVLTRIDLLDAIRPAHGMNPNFKIVVRDVRLLRAWPDANLIHATYVESQFGARNSAPRNDRRSTALFEVKDGRLIWRHLQETGTPMDETSQG